MDKEKEDLSQQFNCNVCLSAVCFAIVSVYILTWVVLHLQNNYLRLLNWKKCSWIFFAYFKKNHTLKIFFIKLFEVFLQEFIQILLLQFIRVFPMKFRQDFFQLFKIF